ncbi:unnamed protein product, partial [Heterosigma akashiwo]
SGRTSHNTARGLLGRLPVGLLRVLLGCRQQHHAYQLPEQLAGHRRQGHPPGQRRGGLAAARPEWDDAFTGQFETSFCNHPVNSTLAAPAHGTSLEDLRANSTLATATA